MTDITLRIDAPGMGQSWATVPLDGPDAAAVARVLINRMPAAPAGDGVVADDVALLTISYRAGGAEYREELQIR